MASVGVCAETPLTTSGSAATSPSRARGSMSPRRCGPFSPARSAVGGSASPQRHARGRGSVGGSARHAAETDDEVKVVVRVRPPLEAGRALSYFPDEEDVTKLFGVSLEASAARSSHVSLEELSFSRVVGPTESNHQTFETLGLKEIIKGVSNGFQETLFAYGQTGSGKTHTILGGSAGEPGLLQLCTHELLDLCFPSTTGDVREGSDRADGLETQRCVQLMCLEIKHEDVIDLIPESNDQTGLKGLDEAVRETIPVKGRRNSYKKVAVWSFDEAMLLLREAIASREVGRSSLNSESSRSHMVVRFIVKTFSKTIQASDFCEMGLAAHSTPTLSYTGSVVVGSLTLVDLAGNEREFSGESHGGGSSPTSGGTREEAKAINVSLTHLNRMLLKMQSGRLDESDRRQSTLNMILYESLVEDCGVTMIFCIHPDRRYALSARSTLQMASLCRRIVQRRKVRRIEVGGYRDELADFRAEGCELTRAHYVQSQRIASWKEEESKRTAEHLKDSRKRREVRSKDHNSLRMSLDEKYRLLSEDRDKQNLAWDLSRKNEILQAVIHQLQQREGELSELKKRYEVACLSTPRAAFSCDRVIAASPSSSPDGSTEAALDKHARIRELELARIHEARDHEAHCQELARVYEQELGALKERYEQQLGSLQDKLSQRMGSEAGASTRSPHSSTSMASSATASATSSAFFRACVPSDVLAASQGSRSSTSPASTACDHCSEPLGGSESSRRVGSFNDDLEIGGGGGGGRRGCSCSTLAVRDASIPGPLRVRSPLLPVPALRLLPRTSSPPPSIHSAGRLASCASPGSPGRLGSCVAPNSPGHLGHCESALATAGRLGHQLVAPGCLGVALGGATPGSPLKSARDGGSSGRVTSSPKLVYSPRKDQDVALQAAQADWALRQVIMQVPSPQQQRHTGIIVGLSPPIPAYAIASPERIVRMERPQQQPPPQQQHSFKPPQSSGNASSTCSTRGSLSVPAPYALHSGEASSRGSSILSTARGSLLDGCFHAPLHSGGGDGGGSSGAATIVLAPSDVCGGTNPVVDLKVETALRTFDLNWEPTAAESSLKQLCRIALQGKLEPRWRAQSAKVALTAMRRLPRSIRAQRDAARLLADIASKDEVLKESVVLQGVLVLAVVALQPLPALSATMVSGSDSSSVDLGSGLAADAASACFRLLAILCQKHTGRQNAVRLAGGLEVVLQCLAAQNLQRSFDVAVHGCWLIMALCNKNKENQDVVRTCGGIDLVLRLLAVEVEAQTMRGDRADRSLDATRVVGLTSATLCAYAVGCIASMAEGNVENQVALHQAGAEGRLLKTLESCLQSPHVVTNVSVALAHIAYRHPAGQEVVRSLGGVQALLVAMLAYRTHPAVQGGVCRAVAVLSEGNLVNAKAFLATRLPDGDSEVSGVALVLRALAASLEVKDDTLATTASWALVKLIESVPALAGSEVRRLFGLDLLVALLKQFNGQERTCEYICKLISEIVRCNGEITRQDLLRLGAHEALANCLERHGRSCPVVATWAQEAMSRLQGTFQGEAWAWS